MQYFDELLHAISFELQLNNICVNNLNFCVKVFIDIHFYFFIDVLVCRGWALDCCIHGCMLNYKHNLISKQNIAIAWRTGRPPCLNSVAVVSSVALWSRPVGLLCSFKRNFGLCIASLPTQCTNDAMSPWLIGGYSKVF